MDSEDVARGLAICSYATTLPWREAGDCLASAGPFPDWFPDYRVDDGGSWFLDIREARADDVEFIVTASRLLLPALAALKTLRETLVDRSTLTLAEYDRIVTATPGTVPMEMSPSERFERRFDELFDDDTDVRLYSSPEYRACQKLQEDGRIVEALACLDALAAARKSPDGL